MGEAYSVVIDVGFMRRIVLVLAVLSGSAVSAMAVTNELAQSAAEKPDDVQLQTGIAEAMRTSPLTANSLIVVHVNQGEVTPEGAAIARSPGARQRAWRNRLSVVNTQTAEILPEK